MNDIARAQVNISNVNFTLKNILSIDAKKINQSGLSMLSVERGEILS